MPSTIMALGSLPRNHQQASSDAGKGLPTDALTHNDASCSQSNYPTRDLGQRPYRVGGIIMDIDPNVLLLLFPLQFSLTHSQSSLLQTKEIFRKMSSI